MHEDDPNQQLPEPRPRSERLKQAAARIATLAIITVIEPSIAQSLDISEISGPFEVAGAFAVLTSIYMFVSEYRSHDD